MVSCVYAALNMVCGSHFRPLSFTSAFNISYCVLWDGFSKCVSGLHFTPTLSLHPRLAPLLLSVLLEPFLQPFAASFILLLCSSPQRRIPLWRWTTVGF